MILVVNHAHSEVCGVHNLGWRLHEHLGGAYAECDSAASVRAAAEQVDVTAVVVNYRADLMPWLEPDATMVAVAHNYGPETVDQATAGLLARGFGRALFCDPTVPPGPGRLVASRPLPPSEPPLGGRTVDCRSRRAPRLRPDDEVRIGSFGFAFPHKGFVDVAEQIHAHCPTATYRLHMPEAWFNGVEGRPMYAPAIVEECRRWCLVDHDDRWLDDDEAVEQLATNHVNCLLYQPGQPDAGLSSALDYLIAARRPILVSEADMFRHARPHAAVWPVASLGDVLADVDRWAVEADRLWEAMQFDWAHLL